MKKKIIICCFFVFLFIIKSKFNVFKLITGIDFYDNRSYISHVIPYLENFTNRLISGTTVMAEDSIIDEPVIDEIIDLEDTIANEVVLPNITVSDNIMSKIYENASNYNNMFDLDKNIYNFDRSAYITEEELIPLKNLLDIDTSISITGSEPRILIFHTHVQEAYIDSREGVEEDTVVGIGEYLADILKSKYNLPVIHDKRNFDERHGIVELGQTYEKMESYVRKILDKHPSIDVLIDIHRDGVPENLRFVTEIDGKRTAKIMFVNGVSKLKSNGNPLELDEFSNPYVKENLAFGLKMKLIADELYPDFTRRTFIKPYRYSLNMRPMSLLVEAGANTNTVEEVKNAMIPLADVLVNALFAK